MAQLSTKKTTNTQSNEHVWLRLADQRVRVLHVRVVTGKGGGPEKTILNSARFTKGSSLEMMSAYIYPAGDKGIKYLQAEGARLGQEVIGIPERGPIDLNTVKQLAKICRDRKIDVWHGHDYKSNLLGLLINRSFPMKLISTMHGWTDDTLRMKIYGVIDKYCLRGYERVVSVSEAVSMRLEGFGVDPKRVSLLQNGIDLSGYDYINDKARAKTKIKFGVESHKIVIGVVGRLSKEKGVDRALNMFKSLNLAYDEVELHIIGDGGEREILERIVAKSDYADCVRFWGWQDKPQKLMAMMDVLLLPSYTEGMPNVVLEAMAMGITVAGTDVGDVREMLDNGKCGVILDNSETEFWFDHIQPLVVSKMRRAELARKARERVIEEYSFSDRMKNMIGLYGDLMGVELAVEEDIRRAA